ncbi:Metalloenzyme, LuxS/M16 peptidase-like protein [Lipomyces kononenkoae]|uniref:Metalloenzyme, LuxS/M16 peptidase-like protein n=1 Tax=Lipomyces kononenkoae TaxID=34357 RepID=A0ACC3T248_LIPKO
MLAPSTSACLRRAASSSVRANATRSLSTAATDLGFESATVDGIKVAATDFAGPITTLSFVIKAGSRYATVPGVAHALQRFAYKNTPKRSGLRLTREAELLGGSLTSALTRDSIVLTARFLKEDLPYFFEALSDVVAQPTLARHELAEIVAPLLKLDAKLADSDAAFVVSEGINSAAYRKGLGLPLYAQATDAISIDSVRAYKDAAYTKANLAIVASGADISTLSSLVSTFLEKVPAGTASAAPASTFYGGELRIASTAGNVLTFGYAADPSPTFNVLASILGGASSIKWSYGASLLSATAGKAYAKVTEYNGSSLLTVSTTGSPAEIKAAGVTAVEALKTVAAGLSPEVLKKGIAGAKFEALQALEGAAGLVGVGQSLLTSGTVPAASKIASEIESVTTESVKSLAEKILSEKVAAAAVGKVSELPYVDELGLKA